MLTRVLRFVLYLKRREKIQFRNFKQSVVDTASEMCLFFEIQTVQKTLQVLLAILLANTTIIIITKHY